MSMSMSMSMSPWRYPTRVCLLVTRATLLERLSAKISHAALAISQPMLAKGGVATTWVCVCKSLPFMAERAASPQQLNRFGQGLRGASYRRTGVRSTEGSDPILALCSSLRNISLECYQHLTSAEAASLLLGGGSMPFSQNLRRLRLERVLSQAELARQSGLHTITISRLEAGRAKPSTRTVRRLAKSLAVTPRELATPEEVAEADKGAIRSYSSDPAAVQHSSSRLPPLSG